ncbi:hypothetical protein M3Y99_01504500 [Aphelenchoides fujianensis]|nr:hypothetical protein M3Y99_01504500 [Aphelenchoides fujianensis]
MPEQPEWLQDRVFNTLARFLPLVDPTAPKGQLLDLFPRFKDCVEELLEDTSGPLEELYTPKCRPLFGRLVHTLLALFGDSKQDKRVRGECCRLLVELVNSRRDATASSVSVAFVLPGIVTKCTAVIKAEPNSEFTPSALLLVREVLQSAMNNELATRLRTSPDLEEGSPVALQRDERWLQTTGNRILQALEIIFGQTAASPLESCRSKLLELVNAAAERCDEVLGERVHHLRLQLAVRFRNDAWEPIRMSAVEIVAKVAAERPATFEKQATVSINSGLDDVLKKRPNSLDALRTIAQFMVALPPAQLKKLVQKRPKSPNFFRRLRRALLMSVDVEKKKILTREAAIDSENIFVCIPLKKTIREEYLEWICEAMVKCGKEKVFFRCVSNSMRSAGKNARLPPTLLMSRLCCAMAADRAGFVDGRTEVVIRRAIGRWLKRLDEFVDLEPDPNDSTPSESNSFDHSRGSAECCALLISLGFAMQTMDPKKRTFQRLLLDVLYAFLQFLPSANLVCASAAQFALDKTAKACGQSTEDFLGENADRVVFKLAAMSRKLDEHPRAPFALAALLDRGFGRKMVDDLVNLIPELLNGINTEDKSRVVPCLKAMGSFVRALLVWFPDLKPAPIEAEEDEEEQQPSTSANSSTSASSSEGEEEEAEGANWNRLEKLREKFEKLKTKREDPFAAARQVPDDEKRPPPPLIACVHRILQRIQHLHHSVHPYTRLLLNELLCAGLRFVRHFDDQLLPMIHQNWVPMSISMRRTFGRRSANISAPEKLIVAAELRTVVCMCETSGTFVYRKILEELDQPLHDYMLETMRASERTSSVYSQTTSFKLQAAALQCWPSFCELAAVPQERARAVFTAYTNDRLQNPELRKLAAKGLERLDRLPPKG